MVYKQWNFAVLMVTLIFYWIGKQCSGRFNRNWHCISGYKQKPSEGRQRKGLPGVRVSNGQEVVKTDATGQYSLAVSDDTILFVIKPAGL